MLPISTRPTAALCEEPTTIALARNSSASSCNPCAAERAGAGSAVAPSALATASSSFNSPSSVSRARCTRPRGKRCAACQGSSGNTRASTSPASDASASSPTEREGVPGLLATVEADDNRAR